MPHPTFPVSDKKCAFPDCDQTFKDHAWGSIKSGTAGWFHQKDGNSWCSNHTPGWVASWRKTQNK